MNAQTERLTISGPAGALEVAIDRPAASPTNALGMQSKKLAVICHPHPLHGGTMDNKVVHTLARAFVQAGWSAVRFNFRGVGSSAGAWDEGRGEVDDGMAVVEASRALMNQLAGDGADGLPLALALAGFSFGGYVASHLAARLSEHTPAPTSQDSMAADGGRSMAVSELVLVAPATQHFPMAGVGPNTLLIHGELDDVVPLQATLDWARPIALPITVVPGAGHFFHGQLPLLKRLVLRHLGTNDPSLSNA